MITLKVPHVVAVRLVLLMQAAPRRSLPPCHSSSCAMTPRHGEHRHVDSPVICAVFALGDSDAGTVLSAALPPVARANNAAVYCVQLDAPNMQYCNQL